MDFFNIELKARTSNADALRKKLKSLGADYKGTDKQTDTYFVVPEGRLKLREGNIENSLIFYRRPNTAAQKKSEVNLYKSSQPDSLKSLLLAALPVWKKVVKSREIYFIDNVKFHIDKLEKIGQFVEIEAIATNNSFTAEKLNEQCIHYMQVLEIKEDDLIKTSYSDMIQ